MSRRRSPLLGLVAGVVAVAALPAAPAAAGGVCDIAKHAYPAHGARGAPLVVGDSSLLVATQLLGRLGFEADIHACRSILQANDVLSGRRRAGTLPRIVVLAVGPNLGIPPGSISRTLAILGPRRLLGLVTPAEPAAADRAERAAAAAHPARIVLIDWARTGLAERYGGSDPVHSGALGEAAESHLIAAALRPYRPPPGLSVPASARGAKRCDPVHGSELFILRGADRITCTRARQLARSDARGAGDWRHYVWSFAGRGPWTDVIVRRDGRVLLAERPPLHRR